MKISLILLFVSLFHSTTLSQLLYYSDIIKGGVTGVGFASGNGGTMSGTILIPEDSNIKKVFFIAATDSTPPPISVILNGIEYTFNDSQIVVNRFTSVLTQTLTKSNSSIRIMDITSDISSSTINYSLVIPAQPNNIFTFFSHFYLLVVFENDNLALTNYDIYLNTQNVNPITNYTLLPASNINRNNPLALSILTSHFCNTSFDGSFIFVNSNIIGLLGGNYPNSNNIGCGVMSNFSYFNNALYGLDNDTPDNMMSGTDALADINNYLNPSNDSIQINFQYQSGVNHASAYTNPIRCIFLTYTSPCQPFETTLLTSDTTTCPNTPLQLGASGGIAYNWLPQTNLSCYDCPNPIFTGDSTINYTVRIWASDSCSKVLPVRVRVSSCASIENLANFFEIFAPTLVYGNLGGFYQIRLKNVQQYQYELYTLDGKVVYQKSGFPESATINLWDKALMESGLYLYRIWVRDEFGNQDVVGGKVVVVK